MLCICDTSGLPQRILRSCRAAAPSHLPVADAPGAVAGHSGPRASRRPGLLHRLTRAAAFPWRQRMPEYRPPFSMWPDPGDRHRLGSPQGRGTCSPRRSRGRCSRTWSRDWKQSAGRYPDRSVPFLMTWGGVQRPRFHRAQLPGDDMAPTYCPRSGPPAAIPAGCRWLPRSGAHSPGWSRRCARCHRRRITVQGSGPRNSPLA